jgi:hypothetical protein
VKSGAGTPFCAVGGEQHIVPDRRSGTEVNQTGQCRRLAGVERSGVHRGGFPRRDDAKLSHVI